jgi:hypothetical protein
MGRNLLLISLVVFYGGIGVFLIGRFLLSVIQFLVGHEEEEL